MKHRERGGGRWLGGALALLVAALLFVAMQGRVFRRSPPPPPPGGDAELVLVTGYCNCGKCCGWKRSWFGFGAPVYTYGKLKGKRKKVGITATGAVAAKGTIAADPSVFPFGTRLTVPGYGEGVVQDVGGSIKGRHIDLWFPSHAEAKKWGAKWLKVVDHGKGAD